MGSGLPLRAVGSLLAVTALALAACKDARTNPDPGLPYQSPDAYSGGTRGGGRAIAPNSPTACEVEKEEEAKKAADADAVRAANAQVADTLWAKAEATCAPDDAADLYKKIADEHKDSPRAEEARWREATKRFEDRDWNAAVSALETYTKDYPVNPHLVEAERLLFESSVNVFNGAQGLKGIFKSDKKSFEGLNTLVDRFPQGAYPDDALMQLGDQYAAKEEWADAALQFHNLLLRYPDSDRAQEARLRLGDVYLARDQGAEYHAGYIDVDPRMPNTPQAAATRPVKSCVEAALASYDDYIDRAASRTCHSPDIAYARERQAECRRRIAQKDRAVSTFYARRGQRCAADTYERFATNAESGKRWCEGLQDSLAAAQSARPSSSPSAPPSSPASTPPDSTAPHSPAIYPPPPPPPASPPRYAPTSPPAPPAPPAPPTYVPPAQPVPESARPSATVVGPSATSPTTGTSSSTSSTSPTLPTQPPTSTVTPPATPPGPPAPLPPPRRTSRDGSKPR